MSINKMSQGDMQMKTTPILLILSLAMWSWAGPAAGAADKATVEVDKAGPADPAGGDLFSISPGPIEDPDVVWSKRIPVAGEEITISARVRGKGKHPVAVRFVLDAMGAPKVTLSAGPSDRQDGKGQYVDYEAAWKPSETGLYRLTVTVDPEKKAGDPATENNVAVVTIPVVWRDLHFLAWGDQKRAKWISTGCSVWGRSLVDIPYWHRRGTLALGRITMKGIWKVGGLSAEEAAQRLMKVVERYRKRGADGLAIDELGGTYAAKLGLAFDRLHDKYPKFRVYIWITGGITRDEVSCAQRNEHILMGNIFERHIDNFGPNFPAALAHRLRMLQGDGMIDPPGEVAIISLAVGRTYRPQIESNVRLYRKLAPAMPGILYYDIPRRFYIPEFAMLEGDQGEYKGSFQEFLDDLTLRYFIKPVLMVEENNIWVSQYYPRRGNSVSIQARIHNTGGMAARNVGVKIYARHLGSNKRELLTATIVPKIGHGGRWTTDKERANAPADNAVVDGTKHPVWYYRPRQGFVELSRALVDAQWRPAGSGYYSIEVELDSSEQYTALEGFAKRLVSVAEKNEKR